MKKYFLIFVTLILILGFAFYWYEYKPRQIRSVCLAEAEFNQTAILKIDDMEALRFIDAYYKTCLHRFGLKE
ncbi:MAG: hypothetical protein PHV78_01700 [Patescibacteria group bacterium]|nr:hypothetical protein [Patescibacteria group bacterium]MDD5121135.1 hypothetical protein [Patescibacteria group bacterium]MDD5221650.1 hypothetical protein [Patescibacteria group bacterium]MDD5395946.1 hypothetical protein [Patescibacteria group bacterium]